MPTSMIVSLYSKLSHLQKRADGQHVDSDQIKHTLLFCEQFVAALKQHPDAFVAQPLLYKSNHDFVLNLTFNSCAYTAILCNQNGVSVTTTVQMLCSILSMYGENNKQLSQFYLDCRDDISVKRNPRMMEGLNKSKQEVWLRGYELLGKLFKDSRGFDTQWPQGLSKVQRLIYLGHYLSLHVTHNKRIAIRPFAAVFKHVVQSLPSDWLEEIESLSQYPSIYSPGTVVKLSGKPYLILSIGVEKVLVCGLTANEQNKLPYSRVFVRNIQSLSMPQKVKGFKQISQWWGEGWQHELPNETIVNPVVSSYKLDQPPAVLLEVQQHLNSHDISIDKLAQMISEEPAFAEYVKTTATFSNRHKLPVQQVKHGLMMHGYERTNHMLIQQALLLRLNQSYFPLQQEFIQFTRLRAQIAELIAAYSGSVEKEQASTLACFACSGLFTQSNLKGRRHWIRKPNNQQDIQSIFLTSKASNLHEHAITLAQAWKQPRLDIQALQYHHLMPDTMTTKADAKDLAVILGLSLIKARQCYFDEPLLCEETQTYLQQGLSHLNLSASDFEVIGPQAMSQNHSYCALN